MLVVLFLIIALIAFVCILLSLYFIFGLYATILGAPYAETKKKDLQTILTLAKARSEDKILDLGAGDGRLVMAFARAGFKATGWEINPRLVRRANKLIRNNSLKDKALVKRVNFWQQSVADYDVIYVFGIQRMMPRLEKKFMQELMPGAKVIVNYFIFPNWSFDRQDGNYYLYIKS